MIAAGGLILAGLVACSPPKYLPAAATAPYPFELHRADNVAIQVFRDETEIEIVNGTAQSFENATLWLNQRYARPLSSLPAGSSLRMSLWDFRDEWGGLFNAGGIWATQDPTPLRLVQIQVDETSPLVGLVVVRQAGDKLIW